MKRFNKLSAPGSKLNSPSLTRWMWTVRTRHHYTSTWKQRKEVCSLMLSNGTSPNSWFLLMARSYRDILPEPLLFNSRRTFKLRWDRPLLNHQKKKFQELSFGPNYDLRIINIANLFSLNSIILVLNNWCIRCLFMGWYIIYYHVTLVQTNLKS